MKELQYRPKHMAHSLINKIDELTENILRQAFFRRY